LQNIADKNKLEIFYLYHSLLGEVHSRLQKTVEAKKNFETAIRLSQSEAEKKMLKDKIVLLLN